MGDELVINTKMDTKGFSAGSKKLENAIKSFSKGINTSVNSVQSSGKRILSTMLKWGPALLGVRGAYQMISRATQAFLAENKQLSANLSSAWTALGNVLGPIITQIVNLITTAMSYFIAFLRLLGLTSKSASEASKSAQGAGAALKKQLMGFDELNVLSDSGGGGGASGSLEDKELPEWLEMFGEFIKNGLWHEAADVLVAEMNRLTDIARTKAAEFGQKVGYYLNGAMTVIADVIKKYDWKQLGEVLALGLNSLILEVDWKNLGVILVGKFWIVLNALAGFLKTFDWEAGTEAFFNVIQGALFEIKWMTLVSDMVDGLIKTFDGVKDGLDRIPWKDIGKKISDMIREFFETPRWGTLAHSISSFIAGAMNSAASVLSGMDGPAIADAFFDAVKKIWSHIEWRELASSFMTLLGNALKLAIDFGAELVSKVWEEISKAWESYAMEDGKFSLRKLKTSILNSWANITTWIETFIVKPFFEALGINFNSKAGEEGNVSWLGILKQKIVDKFNALFGEGSGFADVFNTIIEAITNVWDTIVAFINGTLGGGAPDTESASGPAKLIQNIIDIINNIKEIASPVLTEAWNSIRDFLTKKTFAKGPESLLQKVVDVINKLSGLKKTILTSVWDEIIEPFLTKTNGESGLEKTLNGVYAVVNSLGGLAEEVGGALTTLWTDFLSPIAGWTVNEGVPEFLSKVAEGINSLPTSTLSSIATDLGSLWSGFLQPLVGRFISESIPNFFTVLGSAMKLLSSVVGIVVPLLSDLWNTFLSPLMDAAVGLGGAGAEFINSLADSLVLLKKALSGEITGGDFAAGVMETLIDTSAYANATNYELTAMAEILGNLYTQGGYIGEVFEIGGDELKYLSSYLSVATAQFGLLGDELVSTVGNTEAAATANEVYLEALNTIGQTYEENINSAENYNDAMEATAIMKESLAQATLEYAKSLQDQGVAIDSLLPLLVNQGLSLNDIAEALGMSAEQVASMVGKEVELADSTGEAAKAGKELVDSANETPEAMGNAETSMASYGEQTSTTADDVQTATEKESTAVENMAENNKTSFDTVILNASDFGEKMDETVTNVETSFQQMDTSTGESLSNMATNTTDFGELLKTTIESATSSAKTAIQGFCSDMKIMFRDSLTQTAVLVNAGWQGVINVTTNAVNAITGLVNQATVVIANAAWYWGVDLMINLTNGVIAGWNAFEGTIASVAAMIRMYLGFSEPEKGPLSNFHTFMPDMMQLMADGIEDNMNLPMDAVEDLASGISEELQDGEYALGKLTSSDVDVAMTNFSDKIVGGFENLILRLQEIADNVAFQMPAAASGNFIPYSVGSQMSEIGGEREATAYDIVEAINGLRTLLTNSGANEGAINLNVYLDGQQITDVVTKRQRQTSRAWGTL